MKRRRPAILHDVVQEIANQLHESIPDSVVTEVSDMLRLLDARARARSLGEGDSRQGRAAALLEFQYYETTNKKLKWKSLAHASGVKQKSLQALQRKGLNLLNADQACKLPKSQSTKRQRVSVPVSSSSQNTAMGTADPTPSKPRRDNYSTRVDRMSAISVKLSDYVVDPHAICRSAHQLLNSLESSLRAANSYRNHEAAMYDFARNATLYEGVAMFLVCTHKNVQQVGENTNSLRNPTRLLQEAIQEVTGVSLSEFNDAVKYCRSVLRHTQDEESKLKEENPGCDVDDNETRAEFSKWRESVFSRVLGHTAGPITSTRLHDAAGIALKRMGLIEEDNGCSETSRILSEYQKEDS